MDEPAGLDVVAMSELLGRGEVSPVELATRALDRIEEHNGRLHAFVSTTRERALSEARLAERELMAGESRGTLHGVPFAVKDLFDVAGEVTAAGSSLLAENVATEDCTAVRRLCEAGMVLVGKTHTVQFAFGGVGINHDTGTPHNPWRSDEALVPGGSSSGSAVAVAAGLVPVALGSDTSGSVRIPAALCGVVGLKTTVGQVSRAGVYPLSPTLDSVGPLARSSADCALVYEVMRGADIADPATIGQAPDDRSFGVATGLTDRLEAGGFSAGGPADDGRSTGIRADVAGMRLAFIETMFFDDVDPVVADAVRAAADVFADLGAEVTSITVPEIDEVMGTEAHPHRAATVTAEGYAINRRFVEGHFDDMDPVVARRMVRGRALSAVDFLEALDAWPKLETQIAARTAGIDAFLAPTTMMPAHPVAEVDATPESYNRFNLAYLRNTSIANRLGWCGLSVPCGFTADGLPIGLMIQARAMQEHKVLRIGQAYERATPSAGRRPPMFAG
jgi:aspartyl-tRNA(Asn)/glutamyl-tRNA(Gln) amidotransferase subunit A